MNKTDKSILIISEVFSPEDSLINDIAYAWKEKSYDIHVLTRNPSYPFGKIFKGYKNKWFQKEVLNGIVVFRLRVVEGYKDSRVLKVINYILNMIMASVWAIFNTKRYNYIFIHHTGPLTFSVPGVLASRLHKNISSIWTMDVWPDTVYAYGLAKRKWSSFLLEKFVQCVYKNIDNIIVTSPGFIESLEKYTEKKIHIVPQWSLTKHFNNTNFNLPGKFNIVFAGNISKAQNLVSVLKGFQKSNFCQKSDNVILNIIGDGSELKNLKNTVCELKINNVKFWGRRPLSEMPAFFSSANVLIISLEDIPIFNKTIPAKFQSYLAASKPIFGIINGEVKRLIEENQLGYTANPNDIVEIGKVFDIFYNSKEQVLEQFSSNGLNLYQTRFSREFALNQLSSIVLAE